MQSDYSCPTCRRIRVLNGTKPTALLLCGCQSVKQVFRRVAWAKADWTLTDTPLAEALGVKPSAATRKRHALGKPRGTKGRKLRDLGSYYRRADPANIDPALSVQANAAKLHVSPSRIRQLIKTIPTTPA